MAHSYRLHGACNMEVPVGPDICHRGFAYTVLQTVQRPGVYTVLLMLLCIIKNP